MLLRIFVLSLMILLLGCRQGLAVQVSDYFNVEQSGNGDSLVSQPQHAILTDDITSTGAPIAGSLERRIKPAPFSLGSEWITATDSGLVTADASVAFPLLFLRTPPPIVKTGFTYTNLFSAEDFALPEDLYEYSIGLSMIRSINDRWTLRTMLGVGLATDNMNLSSDAWQFRGGAFGIYQRNENLSWTFGAIALGREDLPVVPAIGAVWMPNEETRVDLVFPRPRINYLLKTDGERQSWVYLGGGINGKTWGIERPGFGDDRLTYKDLRIVLGLESRPASNSRMPFAIGRAFQAEVGYVFSRELEFENETRIESLGDSFMIGVSSKF